MSTTELATRNCEKYTHFVGKNCDVHIFVYLRKTIICKSEHLIKDPIYKTRLSPSANHIGYGVEFNAMANFLWESIFHLCNGDLPCKLERNLVKHDGMDIKAYLNIPAENVVSITVNGSVLLKLCDAEDVKAFCESIGSIFLFGLCPFDDLILPIEQCITNLARNFNSSGNLIEFLRTSFSTKKADILEVFKVNCVGTEEIIYDIILRFTTDIESYLLIAIIRKKIDLEMTYETPMELETPRVTEGEHNEI